MTLWKCCTQYVSKFGKLSSGHRTGKGQFSFQSQRKAMPNNAQTTAQLHSSHTLAKQCSKFSKPSFSNTWTTNFQMFKLDLKKAEDPEIKLSHLLDNWKSQRVPENHLLLLYWLCQSLWLFLGRKAMTNLDSILKSRDITLPTKVYLVKAMVFPVVMYGCESLKRKLSTKELMLLNCGIGEDSWESLGQQGDQTSPS